MHIEVRSSVSVPGLRSDVCAKSYFLDPFPAAAVLRRCRLPPAAYLGARDSGVRRNAVKPRGCCSPGSVQPPWDPAWPLCAWGAHCATDRRFITRASPRTKKSTQSVHLELDPAGAGSLQKRLGRDGEGPESGRSPRPAAAVWEQFEDILELLGASGPARE